MSPPSLCLPSVINCLHLMMLQLGVQTAAGLNRLLCLQIARHFSLQNQTLSLFLNKDATPLCQFGLYFLGCDLGVTQRASPRLPGATQVSWPGGQPQLRLSPHQAEVCGSGFMVGELQTRSGRAGPLGRQKCVRSQGPPFASKGGATQTSRWWNHVCIIFYELTVFIFCLFAHTTVFIFAICVNIYSSLPIACWTEWRTLHSSSFYVQACYFSVELFPGNPLPGV